MLSVIFLSTEVIDKRKCDLVLWHLHTRGIMQSSKCLSFWNSLDQISGRIWKLIFFYKIKKLFAFYRSRSFVTVFTRARRWSLSSQIKHIKSMPSHPVSLRSILILPSHLRCLPNPFSVCGQNFVCVFHLSHAWRMSHQLPFPWYDHSYNIRWRVGPTNYEASHSFIETTYMILFLVLQWLPVTGF
jgi:hypothetical protein